MGGFLYTVAVLLVVLGILVFVHELGHYWAAKAFGVWVHRFAVGMGPPVKSLSFQRGETEWAIAWLPLGGYVKMASREEDPSSGVLEGGSENAVVPPDRMFEAKPVWQRMIIILAGVTLNVAFAWLIFVGLAYKNGNQFDPTVVVGNVQEHLLPAEATEFVDLPTGTRIRSVNGVTVESWNDIIREVTLGSANEISFAFEGHPNISIDLHRDQLVERSQLAFAIRPEHNAVVGGFVAEGPAQQAGLELGDSLVAIDGVPIGSGSDAEQIIWASANQQLTVGVVRDGEPVEVVVTPEASNVDSNDSTSALVGKIGIGWRVPLEHADYSFGQAIVAGNGQTWDAAGTILRTFRGLFTGRVSTREVGGPILIGQLAAQSARAGLDVLLSFMALISVNLAVVNLLPIPVLDGGAFLLLLVEGITRKPIPVKLREAVQVVGLVMIVLLMVMAFGNDIVRLLGG